VVDSLSIFLFGSDTPIDVDLAGRSSRDEWKDIRKGKGRWSKAWVKVRTEQDGVREIYIDPAAIAKVVVDFTPPPSPEGAEQVDHETELLDEILRPPGAD
jgi:hypothetical protein